MIAIRKLYASEIECRVAQCGKKQDGGAYCTILLYKDARVDMKILDEVYGPMNWQREHCLIGDRLYCTIKLYDPDKKEWIAKQDVGTESFTEKEKGQASDSFKRAGFCVGIGRELYTAPKIFVNLNDGEWTIKKDPKTGKDKVDAKISLDVKEIHYDGNGSISRLVLVDSKGNERYTFGAKAQKKAEPLSAPKSDKEMMHQGHEKWQAMLDSILAGKTTLEKVKAKYFFPEADEIAVKEWLLTQTL